MVGKIIKVKAGEYENLSEDNVARVTERLNAEVPISKKEACEMLNIKYNTTRLQKIIDQYLERLAYRTSRKAANRGKAPSLDEAQTIIREYLEGKSKTVIAEGLYRSVGIVQSVLDKFQVPKRQLSKDYFKPELIPDGAVRDRFAIGESVYSARYDCYATIRAEYTNKDGYYYRIFLEEEDNQMFAYQPAYEIASLQHIRDAGVKV
jgi:hypothetical protein